MGWLVGGQLNSDLLLMAGSKHLTIFSSHDLALTAAWTLKKLVFATGDELDAICI